MPNDEYSIRRELVLRLICILLCHTFICLIFIRVTDQVRELFTFFFFELSVRKIRNLRAEIDVFFRRKDVKLDGKRGSRNYSCHM